MVEYSNIKNRVQVGENRFRLDYIAICQERNHRGLEQFRLRKRQ